MITQRFFTLAASSFIAAFMLTACGESEGAGTTTPIPGTSAITQARLALDDPDPLLTAFFPTPEGFVSRYTEPPATLLEIKIQLAPDDAIDSLELIRPNGEREPLPLVDFSLSVDDVSRTTTLTRTVVDSADFQGQFAVTVHHRLDDTFLPLSLDIEPLPTITTGVNALALAPAADGVLWTGTSHNGLLALRRNGATVESLHYPGIPLLEDEDKGFSGPQGNMILSLARQGERSLWIGTWARGLSFLDPGESLLDTADDQWVHLNPHPLDDCLERDNWVPCEMSETPTALLPEGEQGVWVGTLNGLFYLEHGGAPTADLEWHRIADGAITSLERGTGTTLFVGTTLDIEPGEADLQDWPQATAPLLRIDHSGTPTDISDDTLENIQPAPGLNNVMSLLLDTEHLWIGTDRGLYRRHHTTGELARVEVALPDDDIRAMAIAGDGALWLGTFDVCGQDGGALMRLDTRNTASPDDDQLTTWTEATGLKDADVSALIALDADTVAFTSFNLSFTVFNEILGKAEAEGCEIPADTGDDGLTLLNLGLDPNDPSDDQIFDF